MTKVLQADPSGVAEAAGLLRRGALVAFGTETVYGLGGDATNPQAVAAIFEAKGRPRFNPLICHYASAIAAFAHVVANTRAHALADAFWPGPLTLVLPRRADCPVALLASAGLETLAVRVPAHPVASSLLSLAGVPVAAPSANRSGAISPTTCAHVMGDLRGRIAAVLDSGPCAVGLESTVLDLTTGEEAVLLRPGGVTVEALERTIGPVRRLNQSRDAEAGLPSPGLLASHYAPVLPVRLAASRVAGDEGLLAFGPPLTGAGCTFQLSAGADPNEAAARLFEGLRWLDREGRRLGLQRIAAMPVPMAGLGLAINDRLCRAAAPRDTEPR